NRSPPEGAEPLTLNSEVLDVFRIDGRRNRRNFFCKSERDSSRRRRIDPQLLRFAVEVARRAVPPPPFPAVSGELQVAAVRPLKSFVSIQQCLHRVLAPLQIAQHAHRITEYTRVRPVQDARLA